MPRRRALNPTIRAWLHDAARGDLWRYERVSAPVPTGPLISPLRYDVLVRLTYFEYYAERRDAYERDFEGYAHEARGHAYFTYFRDVICPRWYPHLQHDETAFAAAWHWRLRRSAALHESFTRGGFDRRFPITLHAGARVRPTPTGKHVSHRLFAGDGNHRLALLVASGQTELQPSQCRLKRYLRLAPADTTPFCLSLLGVTATEYASFLRRGYPDVPVGTEDGRPVVLDPRAPRADEVRRVIAADLPSISEDP